MNVWKVKMSRYLFGLLVGLTIGGCAGKNTVAGEDKTKAEQLEESLPSWCQSICQRFDACAVAGCDCQGDVCDCNDEYGSSSCPAECAREMERFANDACATIGENYKRCLDTMTCDDFEGGSKCKLSQSDKQLCPETDSGDPPSAVGGGPAVPGGGGTGNVPDPSTGGATGGSASGTAVNCGSGYGTGGGVPDAPSSSAVICEEGRTDCNDGHEYSWICARGSEGQLGCTCFVDSQVTGGFDPQSATCPTQSTVNAGCHWNIAF